MVGRLFGKVMWLGRLTSSVVGVAILFALAIGAANSALAHTNVDNKLFHLGHSNRVGTTNAPGTPTALVATLSDAVKSALVVQNKSGGPALSLGVLSGKAPLTVNASAGTAKNLSADELDGLDSNAFLGKTEKAQDAAHADQADSATNAQNAASADTLGGKTAGEFATQAGLDSEASTRQSADDVLSNQLGSHHHDPRYIQQSPGSAESASVHIDGTLRTGGMLRTGSETGTSEGPKLSYGDYKGLVVRRINSTNPTAGQVLAKTDEIVLERDGTNGGLRLAWGHTYYPYPNQTSTCMGINSSGQSVNHYNGDLATSASGTAQVFTNAQNVVYATCSFGAAYYHGQMTQVTLQRRAGDGGTWVGTVISTFNQ